MFPVTKASMAKANRVKCLANLRQIGVALIQYAGDHSGVFPYKEGQAMHNTPLFVIRPLVSEGYIASSGNPKTPYWSDVFLCPADPNRKLYAAAHGTSSIPGSYIYRQNEDSGDVAPEGQPSRPPIRTTTKKDSQYGYRRWLMRDRSMQGLSGLVRPYPGENKALSQPANWWQPDRITARGYWHKDGVNVLVEDGSVAWRPWGETISF